jgi:hypothetical protein
MIGISVYPEKSDVKTIVEYLDMAAKYNVGRVFTCLLSVDKPKDEIKEEFSTIINHARGLGMHVILDIAPSVFEKLGIGYDDLSFFSELGADGIRLDLGFNGSVEANLSFNKYDLDIELNMSNNTNYLDNIMSYKPNTNKIIGSHNFYPQKYTGLNYEHFISCCERFKKFNLKTAAFVTAHSATEGPWPVMEGLCTLEMHRELPLDTQVKHLYATKLVDDVLIANQFCSEEELKSISTIDKNILRYNIEVADTASELDRIILFDEVHFNRGDVNDYLIRSTQSRVKYKDRDFTPVKHSGVIKKGSIVIGNDNFGQYKGELQLVLNDIVDDNNYRNIVGHVVDVEHFLIDCLGPWEFFEFNEK